MAQILQHNGWGWTDLEPADRSKVFEDLLKDCYEREGITTPAGSTTREGTCYQPFAEQVLLHSPTRASHDQGSRAPEIWGQGWHRWHSGQQDEPGFGWQRSRWQDWNICWVPELMEKWWTVPRPRSPKNMRLSSVSSRISRLCTRTLARTWKKLLDDLQDGFNLWAKPLMICVVALLLQVGNFHWHGPGKGQGPLSEVDRLEGKRKSAPRWAESFEKENPGSPWRLSSSEEKSFSKLWLYMCFSNTPTHIHGVEINFNILERGNTKGRWARKEPKKKERREGKEKNMKWSLEKATRPFSL